MNGIKFNESEITITSSDNKECLKPIIRCIFCEKFEKQFKRSYLSKEIETKNLYLKTNESNEKEISNTFYNFKEKNFFLKKEIRRKEDIFKNKERTKTSDDIQEEMDKKNNSNGHIVQTEENELSSKLINNLKSYKSFPINSSRQIINSINTNKYYTIFNSCHHIVCFDCIARVIFTSYMSQIPTNDTINVPCKCENGFIKLTLNDLEQITSKLNLPEEQKKCEKHDLIIIKYCQECKKNLCSRCLDSHSDLFGDKAHALEDDSQQLNEMCRDHPNNILDTFCNDCHLTVCQLCLIEGAKHYCHNTISYNVLKLNIAKNVENMKYSNYEMFTDGLKEFNKNYEELFNEEIRLINEQLDNLIEKINEYREEFIEKMKIKKMQKDQTIKIIQNIYEFFYKDYSKIPKNMEFPILYLYQIFKNDFISFRLEIPEIKNSFIEQVLENIHGIDHSDTIQNKYQFSLRNFELCQTATIHSEAINSICCLNDGRLVTAGEDRKILIWSKNLDRIEYSLTDNIKPIKIVKTLNDGKLISGGYQSLKVYNNSNNFKVLYILDEIANYVCDIINLEDKRIICGTFREIKVFNLNPNYGYKDGKVMKVHMSWVTSLVKLNGQMFATGSDDKQIIIFDYDLKILRKIVNKFSINCLCNQFNNNIIFDEDNYNNFYIGDFDGNVYLYKYNSQQMIIENVQAKHKGKINQIIQLYGGNYCTIAQDNKIIIHDIEFNPIQILDNEETNKPVNCVTQLVDGKLVVGNQLGIANVYE